MNHGLLAIALLATTAASGARAMEYKGLCEASAGAFLDTTHFAVASDETNTLQVYERGKPDPIGKGFDMKAFTGFDKSDLEGAAAIRDRVYWISSHSFNKKGHDKPERKVFFATRIGKADGKPTLEPVGNPALGLRDAIAKAAGVQPEELNIEALAATPGDGLLIGLRSPLRKAAGGNEAIVIPFNNPAAVVDTKGTAPDLGPAYSLKLGGRALRSMDLIGINPARYIIVAGPVEDGPGFALFRWKGKGSEPEEITDGPDLTGLTPEGAMAVPGQNLVQLLSDDGTVNGVECDEDNDPPEKRKFRSVDVKP